MSYNLPKGGIFVFTDPAAANAILSLTENLKRNGQQAKVDFFVFTNSNGVYSRSEYQYVEEIDGNENEIKLIVKELKPNFVYTGTSVAKKFEHCWRKICKEAGIKSLSFIDYWGPYSDRYNYNNEYILPDELWLVDDVAAKEAKEDGIPEKIIKVAGNPYYSAVKRYKPDINRDTFCKRFNIERDKKIILFISDDIEKSFKKNKYNEPVLGYTEFSVISDIFVSLRKIYLENKINFDEYHFFIKVHPRSNLTDYNYLLSQMNFMSTTCVKDSSSLLINFYSDFIIGMFSNMIIEADLMSKKILRVQTGQTGCDRLKYKMSSKLVLDEKNLKDELLYFLKSKSDD